MSFVAPVPDYKSNLTSLRSWLRAKGWFGAAQAFDEAARYHRGQRKDGQPEFSHQVYQGQLLRTFEPFLERPETTFIACAFHDTIEDHGYRSGALPRFTLDHLERNYGKESAASVDLLSKVVDGVRKTQPAYFLDIAGDPVASAVKAVDRVHNQYTMPGAFGRDKQDLYISETVNWILPMMKEAERNFPRQANIYINLKLRLQDNIGTLVAVRPEPVVFDWSPWEAAARELSLGRPLGEDARKLVQAQGMDSLLDVERVLRHAHGVDWSLGKT